MNWPKVIYVNGKVQKVVPYDLAFELYAALKNEYRHGTRPINEVTVAKVLARYESEINNGE